MPDNEATTPKIARVWRGRTTRDKADSHLRYWREEGGFQQLADQVLARRSPLPSCRRAS